LQSILSIAARYGAPETLADAGAQTGRPKSDFELREISRKQYERLSKSL
jgi:hypothetical protein